MKNVIEIIASEIAKQGQVISLANNSVFAALELGKGSGEDIGIFANKISSKLRNELIFIKTKLIPLMSDYTSVVQKKLAEFKTESELAKYKIVESRIPDLFYELKDTNVITIKRAVRQLSITTVTLPTPKIDDIRNMFKHPTARLNILAEEIISKYSNEELIKIWDKYLLNVSQSNGNIESLGFNISSKIEELVLLFTLLSNIKDERVAGVRVSEDAYKKIMLQFYDEVLNYISIALEDKTKNKRIKKLVLKKINDEELLVDSDVYNEFLKNNGSPETLLGYLISEEVTFDNSLLGKIILKADIYKAAWNKKVKLNITSSKNAEVDKFKTTYKITITDFYNNVLPLDLKDRVSVDLTTAKTSLDILLKESNNSKILDVNDIVKDIIGLIVFEDTNFYTFTEYMLEHSKLNPNISPNEAASLASIDLILDYLLQQVSVEKI